MMTSWRPQEYSAAQDFPGSSSNRLSRGLFGIHTTTQTSLFVMQYATADQSAQVA